MGSWPGTGLCPTKYLRGTRTGCNVLELEIFQISSNFSSSSRRVYACPSCPSQWDKTYLVELLLGCLLPIESWKQLSRVVRSAQTSDVTLSSIKGALELDSDWCLVPVPSSQHCCGNPGVSRLLSKPRMPTTEEHNAPPEHPDDEGSPKDDSTALTAPHFAIIDVESAANMTPKQQRTSSDDVQISPSPVRMPTLGCDNAFIRMILRTFTYFVYDGVSLTGGHKEFARIGKVLVELLVDERFLPPHRADMNFGRKCTEFLVAPAASSFSWFIVRKLQAFRRRQDSGAPPQPTLSVWAKAVWTVGHRIARQALIYRLFFRIGSLRYSLASALGIVCCFFKESIFPDFLRLDKWPKHFSTSQGVAAIFRSIVYALSFSLPLQKASKFLEESPRRRGNAKKLIFAVILSQLQRLAAVEKLISSSQAWAL